MVMQMLLAMNRWIPRCLLLDSLGVLGGGGESGNL